MIKSERQKCEWRDYGGHTTNADHQLYQVDQLDKLEQIITSAFEQKQPIRLRGCGHSMHGLSNPRFFI